MIVSGTQQNTNTPTLDGGVRGFIPKGIRPYDLLHQLSVIVGRPFHLDGPEGWDEMERKNKLSPPLPARAR